MDAIENILSRHSVGNPVAPGPSDQECEVILAAGARAPDHGKLEPWRFLVFQGEDKSKFASDCYAVLSEELRDSDDALAADKLQARINSAPFLIVVGATLQVPHRIPRDEQFAAVAVATQNMQLAAHALGYAAMWRTGPGAYSTGVKKLLNLQEKDAIVAFLFIGSDNRRGL